MTLLFRIQTIVSYPPSDPRCFEREWVEHQHHTVRVIIRCNKMHTGFIRRTSRKLRFRMFKRTTSSLLAERVSFLFHIADARGGSHRSVTLTSKVALSSKIFFGALPSWHITPRGAAFFRVDGQPHKRLCSLPVSVIFCVGSAEKTNQEGRDENRTRIAGSSRVQRLRPLGRGGHSLINCISVWLVTHCVLPPEHGSIAESK